MATDTYIERDLAQLFGRAFARRSRQVSRQVALECEFPVVDHTGAAPSRAVIQDVLQRLGDHGFALVSDLSTGDLVLATRDVGHPDGGQETVSTDLGYATIEVTTPATLTLFAAQHRLDQILRLVVAACAANDCLVLGYGMQPITPPSRELVTRSRRYLMYERFSEHRFLPSDIGADIHLFTISAATHCHIDVGLPEAVRAVNVLNALAGVQIALTANSPIWNGRIDPSWKAPRENFYDRTYDPGTWPSGRPCGVPPAFRDLDDYLESVLDTWVPLVERDGEPLAVNPPGLTAREFMQAATICADTADGDAVEIIPEPSDIVAFAHHLEFDARLCPAHGTVESRISCAQPPGAAVETAAFALGVVENLAAAERLTARLALPDQRRLRTAGARHGLSPPDRDPEMHELARAALAIAEHGLRRRGHGEERLLAGFWERLAARTTYADEDIALFQKRGIQGLLEARAHPLAGESRTVRCAPGSLDVSHRRQESEMEVDEGAELRDALKALQHAREAGDAHRGEDALERALLTTSAAGIDMERATVVVAVRSLRAADDSGTTRLEVRDQAMTRRRWFEVSASGEAAWGDR
jgi:gamma-glutamylcysteine synthetase